jgi:ACT domain-containing protein
VKVILTVIGRDRRGIIARLSGALFEVGANIEEVSQTVLQDNFVMIMLADLSQCSLELAALSQLCDKLAADIGVSIKVQHQGIFDAMHKI